MTDIIDQAQQFEAINLAQALQVQAVVAKGTQRPKAAGHCLNRDCLEPFDDDATPRLYCGPACAEAHHKQMNHGKRF